MPNQKFDLTIINKMSNHVEALYDLYRDLSDDAKERFFNEFAPQNHPEAVISKLDFTLEDCMDILQER